MPLSASRDAYSRPVFDIPLAATEVDLQAIRSSVALVGRLSDGLVRLGPFSLGLEGVLSWVPGLGEIYGAGAATFLLVQGFRARVPPATLLLAAVLMFGRTAISAIPLAGAVASDLLTAHKWAARLILAAIDRRLAEEADARGAQPFAAQPSASQPVRWSALRNITPSGSARGPGSR
jgi:hypothetical protein